MVVRHARARSYSSLLSNRDSTGRYNNPARSYGNRSRASAARRATSSVPAKFCLFGAAHNTKTSGSCAVQMPPMSVIPVRLSIRT